MYGVPLSILSVEEGLDFLIQEIGMNQKGEIKHLCEIARPQIATVVTIGSAHIGHLGSKESIAKEKEYIYRNLPPNAVAVFNKDDSYTQFMYKNRKNYASQSFCFSSQDKSADVFYKLIRLKKEL